MLGMVLADNLLLLVVFWELTSLASFLLIGYWQPQAEARGGRAHGAGRHRRRRACACSPGCCCWGSIAGSYELERDPRAPAT